MISVRGERSESRVTAPQAPPLTVILADSRLERREDGPFPRWRARRERGGGNRRGPAPLTAAGVGHHFVQSGGCPRQEREFRKYPFRPVIDQEVCGGIHGSPAMAPRRASRGWMP
jgi:hypothetical protein